MGPLETNFIYLYGLYALIFTILLYICYRIFIYIPVIELSQKPWSRSKKRDGPSPAPKNEPYRKNGTAHSARTQDDKRPRTRSTVDLSMGGTANAR